MAGVRVAVADPDELWRNTVGAELRREGYDVVEVANEHELAAIVSFAPTLALIDISPGECDGMAIARTLGSSDAKSKVIFLSASSDTKQRLAAFDLGAEDYLSKPISLHELMARIRVVLRRIPSTNHKTIVVGDITIDLEAARVTRGTHVVELTGTEFKLLIYLARHSGRVVSKRQLLTHVWESDIFDPNLVEVHMSALRRKMDANGPRFIRTVRGVGYRLDPPEVTEKATTDTVSLTTPLDREFASLMSGSHRLSDLVFDLLARDRAAAPSPEFAPVDLAKVVDRLLASVSATRSITLNRLGMAIAPVLGDQARLGVLLGNLVENAVRHSPHHGSVIVTIEVAALAIVATVSDGGPGIRSADRERIFDRFVTLDTSALGDHEGLGLGLAIGRAIATDHGGTLTCDEPPSGIGALFTLRLPAAQLNLSAERRFRYTPSLRARSNSVGGTITLPTRGSGSSRTSTWKFERLNAVNKLLTVWGCSSPQ